MRICSLRAASWLKHLLAYIYHRAASFGLINHLTVSAQIRTKKFMLCLK